MYKGTYYWFAKKLLFPSPSLREVVFRGWIAHRAGHRQRLLDVLTKKLLFLADGMSTKNLKKKMQTPLLVQKNLFGFL